MIPETFIIVQTEIHALRVCPCNACIAERRRLDIINSLPEHHIHISPQNAALIGIIPCQSSQSLCRQITNGISH